MPKRLTKHLTRREREIMNALFALGQGASVEDVRARLDDPPSDSAVRVMLARLEKKGAVRRRPDGSRNLYSATVSHADAQRSALRQYVQTFFGGSLSRMMRSLVSESSFSKADLEDLKRELDEHVRSQRRTR